jgi:hypothetical protein
MLFAFAPIHKRAFGIATGVAGAVFMAGLTTAGFLLPGAREFPLGLLDQYLRGYSVSWPGVLVGAELLGDQWIPFSLAKLLDRLVCSLPSAFILNS